MCVGICVCVWGGGEAEKPLTFSSRVRERKEGKGELRMAFSHSVLLPVFLYRSTTCLFILFIYLSSFHFLSITLTSGLHPPQNTHPPPPSKSPLATALQCCFLALLLFLVVALYVRGALLQTRHTHTHKCAHTHTHTCLIICFARLSLTLCIP